MEAPSCPPWVTVRCFPAAAVTTHHLVEHRSVVVHVLHHHVEGAGRLAGLIATVLSDHCQEELLVLPVTVQALQGRTGYSDSNDVTIK